MRRLLNGPAAYLADFWRTVARAWNTFFFTPADPTALGLIRVVVGLLLSWDLAVYGLDMRRVVEPGTFTVWAGGSSAAALEAKYRVTGAPLVVAPAPPRPR